MPDALRQKESVSRILPVKPLQPVEHGFDRRGFFQYRKISNKRRLRRRRSMPSF